VLDRTGAEGKVGGWASYITTSLAGDGKVTNSELGMKWRAGMQLGGVDPSGGSLIVSAMHDDADVSRTVDAFESTIHKLRNEGLIS